ncbi:sensor histidine kinase [Streptomyces sp. N50]|uniref:sensor histidine kinase n=1 Tax=Streptomyces sp. N50 TaxID=3081765 RepID=UPI002962450C|nr:histidine kinase [Streptomyces sp. N50]WOX16354.1 histidine kinase [Streptomyces sp. N50]
MADYRLSRFRGRVTSHPQAADVALGLLVVTVILLAVRAGRPLGAEDLAAGATAFALIAARRRWPLPVFGAVTAASAAFNLHAALVGPLLAANVICTYTVASRTDRRTAAVTGAVTVVTVYVAVVIGAGRTWTDPQNAAILVWGVLAVVVGDATRIRLANLDAVEVRARQAEHSRDEEARRRVVEERLRIARDLHDVVAHHIAVINVQVGVAAHLLRERPDAAEEALAHVRQATRTVLAELSTVLDVLRSEEQDAGHAAATTEPPPGLSRLAAMLDSLAAVGLRVEHRQEGEARPLPSAVDLAAYRIVQESLTNAHKHGSEPAARLRLDYTPAGLGITVENAAGRPVPDAAGCGHGLIGLRERVSSVGGRVRTGRDDGRFTVDAFLPAALDRQDTPT